MRVRELKSNPDEARNKRTALAAKALDKKLTTQGRDATS